MFSFNDSNLQCTLSCNDNNFLLFWKVFGQVFEIFYKLYEIKTVFNMLEILTDNNKTLTAVLFNDSNLQYTLLY